MAVSLDLVFNRAGKKCLEYTFVYKHAVSGKLLCHSSHKVGITESQNSLGRKRPQDH